MQIYLCGLLEPHAIEHARSRQCTQSATFFFISSKNQTDEPILRRENPATPVIIARRFEVQSRFWSVTSLRFAPFVWSAPGTKKLSSTLAVSGKCARDLHKILLSTVVGTGTSKRSTMLRICLNLYINSSRTSSRAHHCQRIFTKHACTGRDLNESISFPRFEERYHPLV
jgi:hypothetical protein